VNIPYEFLIEDDLDFAGKYDDKHDRIVINCSKVSSLLDLEDTIFHEDMHALIAYAADPIETSADMDHDVIRELGFE
jgi:hypothetical protein